MVKFFQTFSAFSGLVHRIVGFLAGPIVHHFIKDSTPSSASTRRSEKRISSRSFSPSAALRAGRLSSGM